MRLCRFGDDRLGLVEEPSVRDVTAALDVLPCYKYPRPRHDALIASLDTVIARVRDIAARDYVAGYCIGLDLTIRGPEERSLRKSVDSDTVVGPWLVTPDEIPHPGELELQIAVNGETRQHSNTKFLIPGVEQLIEFASSFYTLYPGDIVLTGTPEGVSQINPGETIVASIEKIGSMEVHVHAWDSDR